MAAGSRAFVGRWQPYGRPARHERHRQHILLRGLLREYFTWRRAEKSAARAPSHCKEQVGLLDRCLLARSARLLRGVLARAGASTEPAQPCVCLRVGEHLGRVKVHHLKQLKRDARVILPNAHRAQEQQHARRCARQPFGRRASRLLAGERALGAAREGVAEDKLYIWIDYSSVDQDDLSELTKGVNSLGLFVCSADAFITIEHPDYFDRGWCLLECVFADASTSVPSSFADEEDDPLPPPPPPRANASSPR